jgi:alpha,alpha-trehalose phosphorylase
MDLDNLEHNTRDGVHIASLAGACIAAVAGLGGMRDHDGELSFMPRLPDAIRRLTFRLTYRGRRLLVEVSADEARYTLRDGKPLEIHHHGAAATLRSGEPLVLAIPAAQSRPAPSQPPGREPLTRRRERRA